MNGAESVVRTLVAAGIEVCFTNPGTSEMHFVAALDRVPGIRPVLGLFEGVVAGAADGYGRMAERPAATLLHLGPGLGNALANLHNARRARTPIVNLVGEHATYHRACDPPLAMDVEAAARTVSCWVRVCEDPRHVGADTAEAIAAATAPPGGIATLILPADVAWSTGTRPGVPAPREMPRAPSGSVIDAAARALRSGEPAALLLSGGALHADALESAARIAAASGARLLCDTFVPRLARGAGRARVDSVPYFAEAAVAALAPLRHVVLVGTKPPVAFFAYPGKPSHLLPEGCAVHTLATPAEDARAALEALCDVLGARGAAPVREARSSPSLPSGPLHPASAGQALAALLPEGAIVVDEAITAAAGLLPATRGAAPHDWLSLMGGAIGQGMPAATGAALACPGRKVVCLEGDGSAMYTIQSLWTQAREGLDVVNVILANRRYAILQVELARVGALAPGQTPGARAADMLEIGRPDLDFVALARGHGVPGTRATNAEDFGKQLAAALAEPGPHLIEAVF
jgi:acetolactate synthase-1/2/3 large subunit